MNAFRPVTAAVSGLVSLLALAWFSGGCASQPVNYSVPKPGSGIAEYREVVREAHRAVAATVNVAD